MREWLISYECLRQDRNNWLSQDTREESKDDLKGRSNGNPFSDLDQNLKTLTNLWDQCVKIRNDLAHCGMRNNPVSAEDSIQAIQDLIQEFEKFVRQNGIA